MKRLEGVSLDERLATLSGWTPDAARASISRSFAFADFAGAFAFMTELAIHAEKVDHHPSWSNVYNRVVVELSTHDAGGLTQRDIDWALRADAVYARVSSAGPAA